MAASKVLIYNMAAGIVGGNSKNLIASTTEESDIVTYCNQFYEESVDLTTVFIQPYRSRAYKTLSATANTIEKADWGYAYPLPSDYLEMINLTDENSRVADYPHDIIAYESGGDITQYIVSDESTCYIHYIKKMNYDNPVQMSVTFRRLVAANMAVLIAPFYAPKMLQMAEAQVEKWESRCADMNAGHVYIEEIVSSADIT